MEGGREEDCNREIVLSRLKRPVRAEIGRERSVKRLWCGVLLGKRHKIDTGWRGWRDKQMEGGVNTDSGNERSNFFARSKHIESGSDTKAEGQRLESLWVGQNKLNT